jgi:hypothetical protein
MHISLDSALGRQRRLNSVGESVLQIAPSASAAYSLRSLTGGDPRVVRVRRDTSGGAGDDDEQDFTVSGISSGALVNFVGSGNDGYVDTWYDQSGNGRDAVQPTATSQPKIVNDGSLLADGLTFDGFKSFAMPSSIISNINSVSCFLVCKWKSGFNYATALSISHSLSEKLSLVNDLFGNVYNAYGTGGGSSGSTQLGTPDDAKHLISLVVGDSGAESFKDGTSKGTLATASGYTASAFIGSDPNLGTFWASQIDEVIIYDSNQSANRVALETNIQTAYPTLP